MPHAVARNAGTFRRASASPVRFALRPRTRAGRTSVLHRLRRIRRGAGACGCLDEPGRQVSRRDAWTHRLVRVHRRRGMRGGGSRRVRGTHPRGWIQKGGWPDERHDMGALQACAAGWGSVPFPARAAKPGLLLRALGVARVSHHRELHVVVVPARTRLVPAPRKGEAHHVRARNHRVGLPPRPS